MAAIEGRTFGLSVICFDEQGKPASSARDAHTLFVSWFMSNSSSRDVTFVFPKGLLFRLVLMDEAGTVLWNSPVPAEVPDYTVVVPAGGRFAIPINPEPVEIPSQRPFVPLADIVRDQSIPSATELNLGMAIPLASGPQQTLVRLWRAF